MIPLRVEGSSTLALLERVRQMRARGEDVASFAAGEPDFPTPTFVNEAVAKALAADDTKYVATPGIPALREAIAADYRDRLGASWVRAENVLVSEGAKQGLYIVLAALLDAGDEVIVPAPYWVSYPHLVHATGGVVRKLETRQENNFFPTVAELEKVWSPRCKALVFSSPGNPTGCMISRVELEKIARWCIQRKVTLIYDEIYERLMLADEPHVCPLAFLSEAESEYIISVNAFSKSLSMTGWRLGYVVTNRQNIASLSPLHGQMLTCLPGFLQSAAVEGLRRVDEFLPQMVSEYRLRLNRMLEGLAKIPNVAVLKPAGAFYVCVDVRAIMKKRGLANDAAVAEKLLEEVALVVPAGEAFGLPGWLRFSFATSQAEIAKGLERFARFCAR